MKYVQLFFLACYTFFLPMACTNNIAATGNSDKDPAAAAAATTAMAGGKAVFSYQLDGVTIAGGPTDIMPFNNAAQIVQTNDNGSRLQFFLNDADKEDAETFPHSLRFVIPGKTGTTTLTKDAPNWNVGLFVANAGGHQYAMYQNESFTITVNTLSASRVAGSFSGKVTLATGEAGLARELKINNGVFDLPVRQQ